MGSRTKGYWLLWTLALPVFVEGTLGSLSRLVEVCRRTRWNGPGYRLYYGIDGKDIVILLLGGDKSTQNADIKTAQGYWEEHKRRKKPLRLKEKRKK